MYLHFQHLAPDMFQVLGLFLVFGLSLLGYLLRQHRERVINRGQLIFHISSLLFLTDKKQMWSYSWWPAWVSHTSVGWFCP